MVDSRLGCRQVCCGRHKEEEKEEEGAEEGAEEEEAEEEEEEEERLMTGMNPTTMDLRLRTTMDLDRTVTQKRVILFQKKSWIWILFSRGGMEVQTGV